MTTTIAPEIIFPAFRCETAHGRYTVQLHEDGTVTDTRTGDVMWLDCPECGTRPPVLLNRTETPVMSGNGAIGWTRVGTKVRYEVGPLAFFAVQNPRTQKWGRRPAGRCECRSWGVLRLIKHIGTGGRGKAGKDGLWYCSGACINGMHSCDCRCQGLCHGLGRCEGH